MVEVLRRHMVRVEVPYDTLDTCGTGGDGAETFNVSTTAAFVCAAAGVKSRQTRQSIRSVRKAAVLMCSRRWVFIFQRRQNRQKFALTLLALCHFLPHFHPAMKYVGKSERLGFELFLIFREAFESSWGNISTRWRFGKRYSPDFGQYAYEPWFKASDYRS